MPVRLGAEAQRSLRPGGSRNVAAPTTPGGPGPPSTGFPPSTMGGIMGSRGGGLGAPDVYPQDPGQKEDELTAVHVKQGFTQGYATLVSEEYSSAICGRHNSFLQAFNSAKVLADLKTIATKKEEQNTLSDSGKRRQTLNTKDFWPVTVKNKPAADNWFNDLKAGKPLSALAKCVPVFNKKEELLPALIEKKVPFNRAVWFFKMTSGYALAMSEVIKPKKRQLLDPSIEWTQALVRFLKEQLAEFSNLLQSSSSSNIGMGVVDEFKPENALSYKYWTYVTQLCEVMFHQGLLDRQDFLVWVVESVEKCRGPNDPIVRLVLPLVLQYCKEIVKSELLSRRLAYQCAKKITYLVNDTEALNNPSSTLAAQENGGAPPVIAAFMELVNDADTRFVILGLASVVQTVALECPSALVWNYFGDNKSPSYLMGSPLDYLPNCTPSGLPMMPPGPGTQAARLRIKQAETLIRERSIASEAKWSGDFAQSPSRDVSAILLILEELDSFVFDKIDTSSHFIDTLYSRIYPSHQDNPIPDMTVVHSLCHWAVTSQRSGEHRAFVVAMLLEKRQAELSMDMDDDREDEEETFYSSEPPVFQAHLFQYLDHDAPTINEDRQEFSNLVLLFFELICHDVFSHDYYLCQLISRGDLNQAASDAKGDEKNEDGDGSFEDSKINDDLTNLLNQIKEGNQLEDPYSPPPPPPPKPVHGKGDLDVSKRCRHWQYCYHFPLPSNEGSSVHDANQRHVLLYGTGKGKDDVSKNVKRLSKDITKLFSKKFSIDVSDGGKVKKHTKNESSYKDVVASFQGLSYYDQHSVTHQCGQTVVEMITAFAHAQANYLPVTEYVSFLMDLTGLALNIQEILDWSMQILNELPTVELQLHERRSTLTRNYTSSLALCLVGVLRRYHSVLMLTPSDVSFIFDQLSKIAPLSKLTAGDSGDKKVFDCTSAEWCILAYMYDLSTICPTLKSKEKIHELKRQFSPQTQVSTSSFAPTDRRFGIDYVLNPKKPVDPLTIKNLIESPQHQYNLVCNVLMEVCACTDQEKLNDIATLCCEFTSQCYSLSSEWLGAFAALCFSGSTNGYMDLVNQVYKSDTPIDRQLGVFAAILIARHCFHLQAFVINVAIPSLLKAWEEVKDKTLTKESERGARLSCQLLMKLFESVDIYQPTIHFASQSSHSKPAAHPSGIYSSCDRHLLSSAHRNITVGAIIAVLKAILVLGDAEEDKDGDKYPEGEYGNLGSMSGMRGGQRLDKASLPAFARYTLRQISQQDWVHDRCRQTPEQTLLKNGILLDTVLSPKQAQKLLRLICYPAEYPSSELNIPDPQEPKVIVSKILHSLDEWNLRISAIEIRLMYHQLSSNGNNASDLNRWLENSANAIVEAFNFGAQGKKDPVSKMESSKKSPRKSASALSGRSKSRKHCFIWMIPYLVKYLKFLQSRVLKVSTSVLEETNWSRSTQHHAKENHEAAKFAYQPFLQLVLTCIRELDADSKDKKDKSDKEEQKEHLLHALHGQLSTYLCFNKNEKIYRYDDPMSRKTMLESLRLRFSLVGGMFDTICKNVTFTQEWSTLLVQLMSRGVVSLSNNSDLFTVALDMLATLIHSTLVSDKDSNMSEEGRKHYGYHNLVKRLKKEVGDSTSVSMKILRQLLPFPKVVMEALVCEPFGNVTDGKGNRVKGLNCDKKQGMQVADKQKINPWDILEGHRNPAPLSWSWYGALKHERKPLRYEESFCELKYAKDNLEHPKSYYLDSPPLPVEDLEPPPKENKSPNDKAQAPAPNMAGAHSNGMRMGNMMNRPMMNMPGNSYPRGRMDPSFMNPRVGNPRMMGQMGGVMHNQMNPGGMNYPTPGTPNNMMGNNMNWDAMNRVGNTNPQGNTYMNTNQPAGFSSGQMPMAGGAAMGSMNNSSGMMNSHRFPGPPQGNTKQALQIMLRARHSTPGHFNQYNQAPSQPNMGNQFFNPRQSQGNFPMRTSNPRMHPQGSMFPGQGTTPGGGNMPMGGGTNAGVVGGQPQPPAYGQNNMGQYNNYGGNQMSNMNSQFMMRHNQPGPMYGNQGGNMMGRNPMMNQPGNGYAVRGSFMQNQGMAGNAYRPNVPTNSQNMGMRMPQPQTQHTMQNPQMLAQMQQQQQQQQQQQRAGNHQNNPQMNYQQPQNRY